MHRTQLTTWLRIDLRDRLKITAIKRKKKLWQLVEESIEAYLTSENSPETGGTFPHETGINSEDFTE